MKYANFAFRLIVALLLSQVVAIPTNIAGQSAQKPKVLYTQLKDLQGSLKSLASQKGNVAPEVLGNVGQLQHACCRNVNLKHMPSPVLK